MRKIRIEERKKEAKERMEIRSKRTPQQQLEELDIRLGEGIGAKRERERLMEKIKKD